MRTFFYKKLQFNFFYCKFTTKSNPYEKTALFTHFTLAFRLP